MSDSTNQTTGERRREATASFHDRVAAAFAAAGKTKDAEAAKIAAKRCREASATKFEGPSHV